MNCERKRELHQLVEACRETDRTDLEAEKTAAIAELLAEGEVVEQASESSDSAWSPDGVNRGQKLLRVCQEFVDAIFMISDKVHVAMDVIGERYREEVSEELAVALVANALHSDPSETYRQCLIMKGFINRLEQDAFKRLQLDRAMAENIDGMPDERMELNQ